MTYQVPCTFRCHTDLPGLTINLPTQGEEAKRKVTQDLGGLGFSIHEDEPASTSFFTLGGEFVVEAGQGTL